MPQQANQSSPNPSKPPLPDGYTDVDAGQPTDAPPPGYYNVDEGNQQPHQAASDSSSGVGGRLWSAVKDSDVVKGTRQLGSDIQQVPQRVAANWKESGPSSPRPSYDPKNPPKVFGEPVSPLATSVSLGGAAAGAIPTVAKTGRLFEQVEQAGRAAGQTVNASSDLTNALGNLKSLGKMNAMPKALSALIQRLEPAPGFTAKAAMGARKSIAGPMGPAPPLTFQEARNFYNALTNLSTTEKMAMGGKVPHYLGNVLDALHGQIQSAADAMGEGGTYSKAMSDYPIAKNIQGAARAVPSLLAKVARYGAAAAGAGAAGKAGYDLYTGWRK